MKKTLVARAANDSRGDLGGYLTITAGRRAKWAIDGSFTGAGGNGYLLNSATVQAADESEHSAFCCSDVYDLATE